MSGGDLDMLDPFFLVALDSSEEEDELLDFRQTSGEVTRRAQTKISVVGLRRDQRQFPAVRVRYPSGLTFERLRVAVDPVSPL